jgi:hypothetical protein
MDESFVRSAKAAAQRGLTISSPATAYRIFGKYEECFVPDADMLGKGAVE